MNDKTKKTVVFLGTIIVAIMFISSYAAVGNNGYNTSVNTTTTLGSVKTYFASGYANAIVSNYSTEAVLLLNNSKINSTDGNVIVATLSELQSNGSINSYYSLNDSYQVLLGTINAYDLQEFFRTELNSTNSTSVGTYSIITLPHTIVLQVSGQTVPATLKQTNYTMTLYPLKKIGTVINVSVDALLTTNGSIYNNQLTLTLVNST